MRNIIPLRFIDYNQEDSTFLGHEVKDGEITSSEVWLSDAARNKSFYFIGKTGTGKSTFFIDLIRQDIERGIGVCFIDPVGDAIKDLLVRHIPEERLCDVILLDPLHKDYCFGINLYACKDPDDIGEAQLAFERVMHIFTLLFADRETGVLGPRIHQYLSNSARTLIANQGLTMAELPALFTEPQVRQKALTTIRQPMVRRFWKEYEQLRFAEQVERRDIAFNKIDPFLGNRYIFDVVGQAKTTVPFRSIMDEGKILLVKLSDRHEELSRLVGALVNYMLLDAARSRADITDIGERPLFNIYADEFHKFATADFADLVEQARKRGVGLNFGHQRRSQIVDLSLREGALQTRNLAVGSISGRDAEEVAREFDLTPPPAELRDEPIMVLTPTPVDHLVKVGHPNSYIRKFVTDYLTSLTEWANRQQSDRDAFKNGNFSATISQLKEGKSLLNNLLSDIMARRIAVGSEEAVGQMIKIVIALRGFIGFYNAADYHWGDDYYTEKSLPEQVKNAALIYLRLLFGDNNREAAISLALAKQLKQSSPYRDFPVYSAEIEYRDQETDRVRSIVAKQRERCVYEPPYREKISLEVSDQTLYMSSAGVDWCISPDFITEWIKCEERYRDDPLIVRYLSAYQDAKFERGFIRGLDAPFSLIETPDQRESRQKLRSFWQTQNESTLVKGYLLLKAYAAADTDNEYRPSVQESFSLAVPRIVNKTPSEVKETLKQLAWLFQNRLDAPEINNDDIRRLIQLWREYNQDAKSDEEQRGFAILFHKHDPDPEIAPLLLPYQGATLVNGFLKIRDYSREELLKEAEQVVYHPKTRHLLRDSSKRYEQRLRILKLASEKLYFSLYSFKDHELIMGCLIQVAMDRVKGEWSRRDWEPWVVGKTPEEVTETIRRIHQILEKREQERLTEERLIKDMEEFIINVSLSSKEYETATNHCFDALPVDTEQALNLKTFALSLLTVCQLLSLEENTATFQIHGGYEKKPTGTQMTHAQMADKIANDLKRLPDFHFRCILQERGRATEHTIAIPPLSGRTSEEEYQRRVKIIGENMVRSGCYRKRTEVINEVYRRETEWEEPGWQQPDTMPGKPPNKPADEPPSRYGPLEDDNEGSDGQDDIY